jgi:aminoglycoside 3-N-acetyltransferase
MAVFPLKKVIKQQLRKGRLAYARSFQAFEPNDLAQFLAALGVRKGDCLLVHSAYDRFAGFTGKPLDVIRILQDSVGREGILAMPTLPFTGTAVGWAESGQVFDVRRTPSQVGLLTELFRRMPGVLRSVHPTHSVAAWGGRAADFVRDHHKAATPCGANSPYARLAELDGKIMLLGTGIGVLTYFHRVEEEIEPLMPFSPFTDKIYVMSSKDTADTVQETRNRLFDPAISRRRNLDLIVPPLKLAGAWHQRKVDGLDAILLRARDVSATCRALAEQGKFLYDH